MHTAEKESPATGKGRRADNAKSFRGLISESNQYIDSPSVASISEKKARQRETIAWVYREARKRRGSPISGFRIRELERLADHWWNGNIPDSDEGRVFVRVVANHFVGLSGIPRKRVDAWCERFAPWIPEDDLDEIVELATMSPTLYSADTIARAVGLDIETRDFLKLTTIGAYDFDAKARDKRRVTRRAERQRQKRAERQCQKRAEQGATPRAECISQQKPWLAEGISRRTWYRRQREISK